MRALPLSEDLPTTQFVTPPRLTVDSFCSPAMRISAVPQPAVPPGLTLKLEIELRLRFTVKPPPPSIFHLPAAGRGGAKFANANVGATMELTNNTVMRPLGSMSGTYHPDLRQHMTGSSQRFELFRTCPSYRT
jgi:hypothetical protein